jgi:hypothetical protein
LAVKPSTGLIGNKSVHISGKGWSFASPVQVDLCQEANPIFGPALCIQIGTESPTRHGAWRAEVLPPIAGPPPVCGADELSLTAATDCYVQATQNTTDVIATLTYDSPSVELLPVEGSDGYFDAQTVSIKVANFPAHDPVSIELCVPSTGSCNVDNVRSASTNGRGKATFHSYGLNFGGDSMGNGECDLHTICEIVAFDANYTAEPNYGNYEVSAAEVFPIFCGPIVCGGFGPRRH